MRAKRARVSNRMRRLERDRFQIHNNFQGDERRAHLVDLYTAAANGLLNDKATKKRVFGSGRWKKIKDQLGVETHGKCGFCETPTDASYWGDVEHFRPKSVHWWLAYCYDNFLYSCAPCNGAKSNYLEPLGGALLAPELTAHMDEDELWELAKAFAPDPTDEAAVALYEQACIAEESALPNPYHEDVEKYLAWKVIPEAEEVIVVSAGQHPRAGHATDAAIRLVNLNRAELRTQRYGVYERIDRMHGLLNSVDPVAVEIGQDLLEMASAPNSPYSAMVRYFVAHWRLGV